MRFHDALRGDILADPQLAGEDFIIHRRDGLFAYNLAVVVDDHFQGVTEIVRGADLIEPTVRQLSLYKQFGWRAPDYVHLPLARTNKALNFPSRIMLLRFRQATAPGTCPGITLF
ncbi:glutamyl-Q tRNA(Asp) synthetase [Salmonella enterica subsp. arizonae]|uniref:Glutamyl-Q tRNA(Asp) synthetase n=1 Tax=Salmonella enterica subsp. arizonae TaxID=59203 RepID=A0A379TNR7_SALER|nr:glutamyl-Q tRNA(Asp) synthetase [Salmonella enterica subsp. arizonae]